MWWTMIMAMLFAAPGSYAEMIQDPAEMRFCYAAASAQRDAGDDSLYSQTTNAEMIKAYRVQLEALGAWNEAAVAGTRAALAPDYVASESYTRCARLVLNAYGDPLADVAPRLDAEEAAEADAADAEEATPDADTTEEESPASVDDAAVAAGDAARAIDEAAEIAAEDVAAEAAAADLASLGAVRRGEVRCAMLARLLSYEASRGKARLPQGLADSGPEILAGALAERLQAERGWAPDHVRRVYKQDFELYTKELYDMGEAAAVKTNDATIAGCAPLYRSIRVGPGGEGSVGGLAPAEPVEDAALPGTADCYALASYFANAGEGARDKDAKAFGKKFRAIEVALGKRYAREAGDTPGSAAALAGAVVRFDPAAFEALPEPEAEAQMLHCAALAGETL